MIPDGASIMIGRFLGGAALEINGVHEHRDGARV
jgi:hypothetical protein